MNHRVVFFNWDNKTKLEPASFSCFRTQANLRFAGKIKKKQIQAGAIKMKISWIFKKNVMSFRAFFSIFQRIGWSLSWLYKSAYPSKPLVDFECWSMLWNFYKRVLLNTGKRRKLKQNRINIHLKPYELLHISLCCTYFPPKELIEDNYLIGSLLALLR